MTSYYVFLCGVMWCRHGQEDAGRQLMRAAECADPDLNALALAMFKKSRRSTSEGTPLAPSELGKDSISGLRVRRQLRALLRLMTIEATRLAFGQTPKSAVQPSIEIDSRISPTTSKLHGPRKFVTIARGLHLLPALLAFSVGVASAQIGSSSLEDINSESQQHVSVNQLHTPAVARKATEKAIHAFRHGRLDSALQETERALDVCPRCAIALTIHGAVNLSSTNFTQAGNDFQQAIDADSSLGAPYLGLALVYMSQGRFKEALVPLDRAGALLPNSWTVHFEAALAHLDMRDPGTALKEIACAERFMGADPMKISGVSYLRGMARLQMSDDNGAKAALRKAIERAPNGICAKLARKRLEQLGSADDQEIAVSTVRSPF